MGNIENELGFIRKYMIASDALLYLSLTILCIIVYPNFRFTVEGFNLSETATTRITIAVIGLVVAILFKSAFDDIRECATDYSAFAQRRASWLSACAGFFFLCGMLSIQILFFEVDLEADLRIYSVFLYFPSVLATVLSLETVGILLMIGQTRRESDKV